MKIKMNTKTSKDSKYNKKRKPLFRVEIVPSDDSELLEQIKKDLVSKSGTPKQGVIELYNFAKQKWFF